MSQRITSQISQLFAAGRFAEAEKLCLSAAETSPGDSMIPAIRGAIKLELGDIKSAVTFLSKAISLDPRNATAHFNLGVAHKKLMQLEGAMASFRTALGLAGPKPVILTAMGLTELARGRNAEAAMILEQAARKDAQSPVAFLNWGEALKATGERDRAISAFNRALSLQPDYVDAINSLGTVYAEMGKPEEAEQHFRRALSVDPKHVMTRNNLGVLLKSKGLLAEALSEFEAANAADPNYAMAFFNAGTVLKDLQRSDAALQALRRAVQLRPDLAEAHLVIGWIHFDDDSVYDAKAALTRAVQVKPDYVDAHVALGALYRKLRNWKEARASYDRALAIDFQNFEALLGLGQTFNGQGLFAAADECFRRALEKQPQAPAARLALAKALFDQSKLDEAETCCRDIISALPSNGEAHLTLADILSKQRRVSEAIPELRRALELMPMSMRGYVKLAESLEMVGRQSEVAAVVQQLEEAAAARGNDFSRIKKLLTMTEITGDLAPYEQALDLAVQTGRLADFNFYSMLRPNIRILPERAPSLIEKLNTVEKNAEIFQQAAFYRGRSLLLHEVKSYKSAWQDLMRANRLVLDGSEIEVKEMPGDLPAQLNRIRNSSWNLGAPSLPDGCQPVFILGSSRSGKSMLENFLALSDRFAGLDEYAIIDETCRSLQITREMLERGLDAEQGGRFAEHLLQRCRNYAQGNRISFTAPGHIRAVKLVAETLPGARFIFMRRNNEMDVVFRCLQKLYRRGNYYSYDVKECLAHIRVYNEMMNELSARLGDRARTITYEDLVTNAPVMMPSLWSWLGIEPPPDPKFELHDDIGCSEPYRDLIAAELN